MDYAHEAIDIESDIQSLLNSLQQVNLESSPSTPLSGDTCWRVRRGRGLNRRSIGVGSMPEDTCKNWFFLKST